MVQAHVSDFVRHVVSLTEQPPGFEQLATSFDSNSAVGIEAGGESLSVLNIRPPVSFQVLWVIGRSDHAASRHA